MTSPAKHAIVLGASGISGRGVTKELLNYPTSTTFASITGVTNRHLTIERALLPNDPRLRLVSGIDLTSSPTAVVELMKAKIPNVGNITHAFYCAYAEAAPDSLSDVNGNMLNAVLIALKKLCPRLEHIIWQTGAKTYGIDLYGKTPLPPLPWNETTSRVQSPELDATIFYRRQLDLLTQHAEGSSWTWSEVRPDNIIAFAPIHSPMNLAVLVGIYLTLWRRVYGAGAVVPYPGSRNAYERTNNETPMSGCARFEIFLSLKGQETNGKAYNIGAPLSTYGEKWGKWAAVFGLVGGGPASENGTDARQWCFEHKDAWLEVEREYGLTAGLLEGVRWDFFYVLQIPFDREFDLTRMSEVGFTEELDATEGYKEAWSDMIQAKMLPPLMVDSGDEVVSKL